MPNCEVHIEGYSGVTRYRKSGTSHLDAAVVQIYGQSNSAGQPLSRTGGAVFTGPAPNVFTLTDGNHTFSQYNHLDNQVINGGGILANSVNPATELAREWQSRIDSGEDLPNLYIIQLGIGGRGMSKLDGTSVPSGRNVWNPSKERGNDASNPFSAYIQGSYDINNTSLWDATQKIVPDAIRDILGRGLRPVVLGALQVGFENEAYRIQGAVQYYNSLRNWRNLMLNSLGLNQMEHFIVKTRTVSGGIFFAANTNGALRHFEIDNPDVTVIDPRRFAGASATTSANPSGMYATDGVHYTAQVQNYFAKEFLRKTINISKYGHVSSII